jgi:hypothetical protein
MLMYSRCFCVWNVRYSVWNRILPIIRGGGDIKSRMIRVGDLTHVGRNRQTFLNR